MFRKTSPVAGFTTHRLDVPCWASAAMREMEADIACAVRCDVNVLITGEQGVGKTSVARRIHRQSRRGRAPLIVASSPAAREASGSFEGALLEAFPEGAVLVENPERLSRRMRLLLQRFVEGSPIPGPDGRSVARGGRVRFITTTGVDLFELVRDGRFSESLFYRLNAVHLVIPPLRERAEDIPVLLRQFLSAYEPAIVPRLSAAARQQLAAHLWPGNLCELREVVDSLASLGRPRVLEPDDLPSRIRS
jgi:DNA-binding NtrC family response regulator